MKKYFSLILLLPLLANSQNLLIDKRDSSYETNELTLSARGKTCEIINYLEHESIPYPDYSIKLLIVIKIFGYDKKNIIPVSKPSQFTNFSDYVKNNALPALHTDMLLQINRLESSFRGSNMNQFDSLIIYDGKSYQYIPGVILVESFNLMDFNQVDVLQTNQTILNTSAKIVPIYNWVQDGLPIPNVDAMIDGKIFLLRKKKDEYTFFRWPFDCSDCPLTFYNEYVYKKDYGVIAFKSKYLFPSNNRVSLEKIGESREYYYFR